jgi:hypothetical protein
MMRLRLPEVLRPLLEKPTHPRPDQLRKNGSDLVPRTVPDKRSPSGLDTQESATTAIDLPLGFEKPRFI